VGASLLILPALPNHPCTRLGPALPALLPCPNPHSRLSHRPPAALPARHLPTRFPALALFGRRSPERVVRSSLPASENLHNSGHCWRPPCRCANNVQTRSNGIETYQVNPWSRWAGGPCPCRCRRSQQRLPQRESRPKRRVLFSLEFPFLSRHAMHTSCLAAPLVARGSQWFTGSGDSGALQRGLCPWGHSYAACAAKPARKRLPIGPRHPPLPVYFRAEFE